MPKPEPILNDRLLELIHGYLEETRRPRNRVAEHLHPDQLKQIFDLNIPDEGCSWEDILSSIESYLKHSVRTGHPMFLNQLWSGWTEPGFVGDLITSLTNTSMYTYEVAPVATLMENYLINKMGRLAGFHNPDGLFVSGGSNGNLIAMMIARNRIHPEIKRRGFCSPFNLIAYVSDQAHYSFEKAANILGIGTENVIKIRSDKSGCMMPAELREAVERHLMEKKMPFFVAATAGTTVLGAFDPCDSIAEIAEEFGLWFHVDGSFGGTVLLSPKHRHLLKGLEQADSFAWNPHKLMGLPLICSVLLTKENGHLYRTNSTKGTEYIFHDEGFGSHDLGPKSLQCGRRVDGLKLWLSWKYYGDSGYAERIDRFFDLAVYAEQHIIDHPHLELMAPRSSVSVCFRYIPFDRRDINKFNLELREFLAREGSCLVNYSYLENKVALRPVIANLNLSRKDMDDFFDRLHSAAEKILKSPDSA